MLTIAVSKGRIYEEALPLLAEAGITPIDDPQIALAALVVNQDKWQIKASYLGEQALEAFFK